MKKQIIRLTENDLHSIIEKTIKSIISERELGQGEKFTPYSKEDRERNFGGLTWGTPEERNPSYAAKKAEVEARKRKK